MNVSIISDFIAKEQGIEIPLSHLSENEAEDWQEQDYNYRLNSCSDIYYAVVDNKVVGHIGLYEDQVKCLFVDESLRGNGISIKLYEYLFSILEKLDSDDAREPSATYIWKKLQKQYPSNIRYDSKKDIFTFKS